MLVQCSENVANSPLLTLFLMICNYIHSSELINANDSDEKVNWYL